MNRVIFLALLLTSIALATPALAQDTLPMEVVPGMGIGDIKLGMSSQEITDIVGMPDDDLTREQLGKEYSIKDWENETYGLADFDRAFNYQGKDDPFWMISFKNDQVVFIMVTYGRFTHKYHLTYLGGPFPESPDLARDLFGQAEEDRLGRYDHLIYRDKGLALAFTNSSRPVGVIVFKP